MRSKKWAQYSMPISLKYLWSVSSSPGVERPPSKSGYETGKLKIAFSSQAFTSKMPERDRGWVSCEHLLNRMFILIQIKKQRNNGHVKKDHGHIQPTRWTICIQCAQGQSLEEVYHQNIVMATVIRDISKASVCVSYVLPKLYGKLHDSVSYAIHAKVVRN